MVDFSHFWADRYLWLHLDGLLGRQFAYLVIRVMGSIDFPGVHPVRCWKEQVKAFAWYYRFRVDIIQFPR